MYLSLTLTIQNATSPFILVMSAFLAKYHPSKIQVKFYLLCKDLKVETRLS